MKKKIVRPQNMHKGFFFKKLVFFELFKEIAYFRFPEKLFRTLLTQYNKNNPEYYSQCILSLTLILNSFVLLNFIEDYHKNLTISLILFVIIFILILI